MKKTIFMLFLLAVPFLSRAQGVPVEGKGSMIGIKSNIPYWATARLIWGLKFISPVIGHLSWRQA